MKLSMELTLAGLVGALRLKAHGLAEDVEAGYAESRAERPAKRRRRPAIRDAKEGDEDDDRRRR